MKTIIPTLYKRHIKRDITMNKEFKKDLTNAFELKNFGNNKEALELYEKLYQQNPEGFNYRQKVDYAWTIIKVRMKDLTNQDELIEAANYITQLLPQADLKTTKSCPYTTAVFKVLISLRNDEKYYEMIPWLEKLNPELLDENEYRSHDRIQKPRKEKYYDWASKAYLEVMEFEKCIEVSKTALETLDKFHDEGDTWFKWRIAKSLKQLNQLRKSLSYYLEVIEVKDDWYMYRDIAEIYYELNKPYEALDYLCPAILSRGSINIKANLYYLCYKVFKLFNEEMAIKHAQLYYLLRLEKGYYVPYEIEKLNFDETQLNKRELQREITGLWIQYKYKDQKRHYGTVIKFFQDKNFGFIKTHNDENIFFHKNEFKDDTVYVGQLVSFFTEESFDKSKNRKSQKAVIVRGE